ncbi:MAG: uroporphyrinogen decarboxylase [Gammaproteobacteria bacterium]|nr:MAG: uroporphyrinogen decarboxylase [Gammaproteobacteria bacterium]
MSAAPPPRRLRNDRLLRALARRPVDRAPVWIMRQAGRYLPEYRRVRAAAGSFMALCTDPERACEVTLQPLRRFGLDAAILFSDILTIPDAMGLGLYFVEGEGPRFERPLRDAAAITALPVPDPEDRLRYVLDAVRLIRRELGDDLPLIGFAGSPWTLATYMVEGGASRDFVHAKRLIYDAPGLAHTLLEKLSAALVEYLAAQAAAGADALMLFDTWGGVLDPAAWRDFSLAYLRRIAQALATRAPGVPLILFGKGAHPEQLAELADTGAAALGVDWTVPLDTARRATGDRVALQGNLDPAVLHASPAVIEQAVARVLADYGHGHGHVFNLGHGIQPSVDPEHVSVMVEAVRRLSPTYKSAPPSPD